MVNIPDSFKKIVIVKDDILLRRDENGIVTMGLKQFLLDENSLNLKWKAISSRKKDFERKKRYEREYEELVDAYRLVNLGTGT